MPWSLAAAGVGLGSAALNASNSGDASSSADAAGAQANALRQQAAGYWTGLTPPTLNKTPLGGYNWLQDYSPQNYDPYTGGVSQTADDPNSLAAQKAALDKLAAFSQGGLQPADRIALDQIQKAQAGAGTSAYNANRDSLRSRGLGGAGADEAARLSADQGASDSASSLYDNALKTALDRQLSATTAAGTLGGNIRANTQNINTTMANINNAFNTQVQNLRTNAAITASNNANQSQLLNEQGRQSTANTNVGVANQNLDRANTLAQNDFANKTTIAAGASNAVNNQATAQSALQAADQKNALGYDQLGLAGVSGSLSALKTAPSLSGMFGTGGTTAATSQAANDVTNPYGSSYNLF